MVEGAAPLWVDQIRSWDEPELPDEVRSEVTASPEQSVPLLLALLGDEEMLNLYGAIHVIEMLGQVEAADAIPALVNVLVEEPGTRLADAADEALRRFGADAVPALMAAMEAHADCVSYTLGGCAAGTADPEVREALLAVLADDPDLACGCLAAFGDPSVIPMLMDELAVADVLEDKGVVAGQTVIELVRAIEKLGGDAGALGRRRIREVEHVRAPMRELLSQIQTAKSGIRWRRLRRSDF
ncbi:MAG: hypothetical protein KTR31_33985 [Myxococcales bacterium]|nr:hypothetical protein [Myxococcales bacterium]